MLMLRKGEVYKLTTCSTVLFVELCSNEGNKCHFSDITESGAFTRLGIGSFLFHFNYNGDMKSF